MIIKQLDNFDKNGYEAKKQAKKITILLKSESDSSMWPSTVSHTQNVCFEFYLKKNYEVTKMLLEVATNYQGTLGGCYRVARVFRVISTQLLWNCV